MTLTLSFEIPDALYEKAQSVAHKQSETVEGVLQDQFYQWFKQYWAEKAETVSRQSFLDIVNRAPQIEPPLEADRL